MVFVLSSPTYSNILSQGFFPKYENSIPTDERTSQQNDFESSDQLDHHHVRINEDFLLSLSRLCRLSPSQSIGLGISFLVSHYTTPENYHIEVMKFVTAKIDELENLGDVGGLVVADIVSVLSRKSPKLLMKFEEAVLATPSLSSSPVLRTLHTILHSSPGNPRDVLLLPPTFPLPSLGSIVSHLSSSSITVAKVLMDFGPQCSQSPDQLKSAMAESGVPITEDQVAQIMAMVVGAIPPHQIVPPTRSIYGQLHGTQKSGENNGEGKEEKGQTEDVWNLEVIAGVLAEIQSLDWMKVAESFDNPHIVFHNLNSFLALLNLFSQCSSFPFPPALLLRPWENPSTHYSFLQFGLYTNRSILDFTTVENKIDPIDPKKKNPQESDPRWNGSWACADLYHALALLGDQGDVAPVRKLCLSGISQYPEYAAVGFAMSLSNSPKTSSFNSLPLCILNELLPHLFTGVENNNPTCKACMIQLAPFIPDTVKECLLILLDRATSANQVNAIYSQLILPLNLRDDLVGCGTPQQLLPLLCLEGAILLAKAGPREGKLSNQDFRSIWGGVISRWLHIPSPDESGEERKRGDSSLQPLTLVQERERESSLGEILYFVESQIGGQAFFPKEVLGRVVWDIWEFYQKFVEKIENLKANKKKKENESLLINPLHESMIKSIVALVLGKKVVDPNLVGEDEEKEEIIPPSIDIPPDILSSQQPPQQQMYTPSNENGDIPTASGEGSEHDKSGIPVLQNGPDGLPLDDSQGSIVATSDELREGRAIANNLFTDFYRNGLAVEDMVGRIQEMKKGDGNEKTAFRIIIQNLFTEYYYFHKLVPNDLIKTAQLFGLLIKREIIASITLSIGLRYLLESIRVYNGNTHPPPNSDRKESDETLIVNKKMYQFAIIVLQQFCEKFHMWPIFCAQIAKFQIIGEDQPVLFGELVRGRDYNDENGELPRPFPTPTLPSTTQQQPNQTSSNQSSATKQITSDGSSPFYPSNQGVKEDEGEGMKKTQSSSNLQSTSPPYVPFSGQHGGNEERKINEGTPFNPQTSQPYIPMSNNNLGGQLHPMQTHLRLNMIFPTLDLSKFPPPEPEGPSSDVTTQVSFLLNNITSDNVDTKAGEISNILTQDHHAWLGFKVVERATHMPNLHTTYHRLLRLLNYKQLDNYVLHFAIVRVCLLVGNQRILTNTQDRSILRMLGTWVGLLTLGVNRPVLQREIDLKELLYQGYETGRLMPICSFVCKILEGCKGSVIFKFPNPWFMSLFGLLKEIHTIPGIKMNIKFDVELVCNNLGVTFDDLLPSQTLHMRMIPPINNPDLANRSNVRGMSGSTSNGNLNNNQQPSVPTSNQPLNNDSRQASFNDLPNNNNNSKTQNPPPPQVQQPPPPVVAHHFDDTILPELKETTTIPNLNAYTTVPSYINLFQTNPELIHLITLGVDKAVTKIIQPIVDRTATIARITTRELIVKDFAMEPDGSKMREAGQNLASYLAKHLSNINSRDVLIVQLTDHFKALFSRVTNDQSYLDKVVKGCVDENIDRALIIIEHAAQVRAMQDVEELLTGNIQARRKRRDSLSEDGGGGHGLKQSEEEFVDLAVLNSNHRYPRDLPPMVWPSSPGLESYQLELYASFKSNQFSSTSNSLPTIPTSSSSSSVLQNVLPTATPNPTTPINLERPPPITANLEGKQLAETLEKHLVYLDGLVKNVIIIATASDTNEESESSPSLSSKSSTNHKDITLASQDPNTPLATYYREFLEFLRSSSPFQTQTNLLLSFCRSVFKHMVSTATFHTLVFEVMIGVLETVNENCPQSHKKSLNDNINGWMLESFPALFTQGEQATIGGIKCIFLLASTRVAYIENIDNLLSTTFSQYMNDTLEILRQTPFPENSTLQVYLQNTTVKNLLVWVDFSSRVIRQLLFEKIGQIGQFNRTLQLMVNLPKSLPPIEAGIKAFMDDIQRITGGEIPSTSSSSSQSSSQSPNFAPQSSNQQVEEKKTGSSFYIPPKTPDAELTPEEKKEMEELMNTVKEIMERWIQVCTINTEESLNQFLQFLQQCGVVKTEQAADEFFHMVTDVCISKCFEASDNDEEKKKSGSSKSGGKEDEDDGDSIDYTYVDTLSKLLFVLIRLADRQSPPSSSSPPSTSHPRVNLLIRMLSAINRVLVKRIHVNHSTEKSSGGGGEIEQASKTQKPFFRLITNLLRDVITRSSQQNQSLSEDIITQQLSAFMRFLHATRPSALPTFAFTWMELFASPLFFPKTLMIPNKKGWEIIHFLLLDLLSFLSPLLRSLRLTPPLLSLQEACLRVLLVLLHDFPEFLCEHYVSICGALPPTCIQMRNIVLSAFPRRVHLPDPFTLNLKIDRLPDIGTSPTILTNFEATLTEKGLKPQLDAYLTMMEESEQPGNLEVKINLLTSISHQLCPPSTSNSSRCNSDPALITALALYVANRDIPVRQGYIAGVQQRQEEDDESGLHSYIPQPDHRGAQELFLFLLHDMEVGGRYVYLSCLTNQLRFPNVHTHYFSCTLLYLFMEASCERIQDQITRVMLERLIAHRPHPWGLVITFMELIKNRKCSFWDKEFWQASPEIKRVFERMALSNAPSSSSSSSDQPPSSASSNKK